MNEVHFLKMFPTNSRRPKGGGNTYYPGGNKMNEVHFLKMFPTNSRRLKGGGNTYYPGGKDERKF